jgi:hypothetical protein
MITSLRCSSSRQQRRVLGADAPENNRIAMREWTSREIIGVGGDDHDRGPERPRPPLSPADCRGEKDDRGRRCDLDDDSGFEHRGAPQSTCSLVITSGEAMRIVCPWLSLVGSPCPAVPDNSDAGAGAQGRNRTLPYRTENTSFFEWRPFSVPTSGPGGFFTPGRVRLCAAIPKSCACHALSAPCAVR